MAKASTWTHVIGTFLPHPAGKLVHGLLGPSSPLVSSSLMVTCCLAPPQLGPEMTGGGLGSLPAFSAQARLSPAGSCVYVCVCVAEALSVSPSPP